MTTTETRYCGKCGEPQGERARFCRRCGASIDDVSAYVAPTTTPPRPSPDSAALRLWRGFRAWRTWAQVAGWVFGFWLLVPLYLWRSRTPVILKVAVSAVWGLFMLSLALTPFSDSQPDSAPSLALEATAAPDVGTQPAAAAGNAGAISASPTQPKPESFRRYLVTTAAVQCYEATAITAGFVKQFLANELVIIDQRVRFSGETWFYQTDAKCWLQSTPDGIRVFERESEARDLIVERTPIDVRKAQAKVVDPRLLVSDPNSFKGQAVILQGKALNVDQKSDHTWVQVMAQVPGRSTTESIVVEMRPRVSGLLSDECYRFYGVVQGTTKVRLILTGVSNDVPLVYGFAAESSPRGRLDIGCTAP